MTDISQEDRDFYAAYIRANSPGYPCARSQPEPRQPGQVPSDHPDAGKPVGWGEHPRDCDCGDCP
jgi:hypothetical protein